MWCSCLCLQIGNKNVSYAPNGRQRRKAEPVRVEEVCVLEELAVVVSEDGKVGPTPSDVVVGVKDDMMVFLDPHGQ